MPRPKQDSQDDRLVMLKHKQIYPNEQELTAVQNIVSAVEKALKLVSDNIADEDAPVKTEEKEEKMEVAEGAAEEKADDKKSAEGEEAKKQPKPKEKNETSPSMLAFKSLNFLLSSGVVLKWSLCLEILCILETTNLFPDQVGGWDCTFRTLFWLRPDDFVELREMWMGVKTIR